MDWLIAIGRMLGLGTLAGLRPSLTVAVIGLLSQLGWGAHVNDVFVFLENRYVILAFVVLAVLESGFDKIPRFDRLQDRLTMPYRLVIGAVAGAATAPFGWPGIAAGVLLGLFAAWFALTTKHGTRPRTVPSDAMIALLSMAEDLVSLLGAVLILTVPWTGYLGVGVTAYVFFVHRYRRRAKYRRLRQMTTASPPAGGPSDG
jgi:uncharacterized membrane protein